MQDYNSTTDQQLTRKSMTEVLTPRYRKSWICDKPCYDVRVDAYWLVGKKQGIYHFAGPVSLSKSVLDLLPQLTELERRAVLRHLPVNPYAPYGIDVEESENLDEDGA